MSPSDTTKSAPPTIPSVGSTLARAADLLSETSGRVETVVGLVNGRVLRMHAPALTEYLALRLGTLERARRALVTLRAALAEQPADSLVAPPGVRAQLYRIARAVAFAARSDDTIDRMAARRDLPWATEPSPELPAPALRIVRTDLPDDALELLELRHVRDLTPDEIACVTGRRVEDVYEGLDDATELLVGLLDTTGRGRAKVHDLLRRALAIADGGVRAETRDGTGEWLPLPRGTLIGGRYALECRVGSGAFGDVYRATDAEVPGHVLALKLLHQPAHSDEAREAAMREIRLLASVFHPSLVQFKDHGWHEGRLWFAMPWYEGETLEARIRRGALSRGEAHDLFVPLARALATLHASGIRHQDVKPENIFLARMHSGEEEVLPVLLDLGVAAKEAEMVVAGTPTYFAPEVADQFVELGARRRITSKSDVFSLALSLRNALEPENEETVSSAGVDAFIARRARQAPKPFARRDLRYLDGAFGRFLAQDPEARPDADALAKELSILVEPERRRARRRSIAAVAIPLATLLLGLTGVVGFALEQRAERKAEEAARASLSARTLRQDLAASESSRARLAQESARISGLLEHGRLSRAELARHLERTEQELAAAGERLRVARVQTDELRASLAESTTREQGLRSGLSEAEQRLEREKIRTADAEQRIALRQADLERAEASLREAALRQRELEAQATTLSDRLSAERARGAELERAVAEARNETARALAARDEAESDAQRWRRRATEAEALVPRGEIPRAPGSTAVVLEPPGG
ncbi:MAG: protein kinase [Polyangiales bacterium]